MSSVTTFAAAVIAAALATLLPEQRARLLIVAGVLALFSLDDAIQLHETLGERANAQLGLADALAHATWPLVFLPLLAFVFVVLWQVAKNAAKPVRLILRIGLGLLALGIATEALAAPWYAVGGEAETFVGAVQIVVEEGAELGGWILLATGLAAIAFGRAYAIGRQSAYEERVGRSRAVRERHDPSAGTRLKARSS
jgi:hypothetical protein